MPCISVIIPIFNKKRYVQTILTQLRDQSFRDYECIIVDDGSTDGSSQICDHFCHEDERFRVFHIQNGGVSHARNLGMGKAEGEFLTFVDADDQIHRDYLKNLYDCITQNGVDMVIGSIQKVWTDSNRKVSVIPPYTGYRKMAEIMPSFAQVQRDSGIFGICTAKLFRKGLAQNYCFDESLILAEDFDFYLKLYKVMNTVFFDDKPYYYYLQVAQNSSSLVEDRAIDYLAQLRIMIHYRDFLQSKNAYCGENEEIVAQRLSDYSYFVLLYAGREKLKQQYSALRSILLKERFPLHGKTLMQKWVLFTLKNNLCVFTKATFILYDFFRKLLRRNTQRR